METTTVAGIEISRIGLGTWAIGGLEWGSVPDSVAIATILSAADRGINLIDTAPIYGHGHAEEIVGSWGLAAYHRDSDRPRTEAEAKRQCNNPYVVKRGPNGGVIMHLADVPEPQELVLKGGPGGANYLGPAGAPGLPEDREVFAVSDKSFSVKWVSPENSTRYGMMIYVRCG